MKTKSLIQKILTLALLSGIAFNLPAQIDLTIRGYVFSNNAPLPGWPVSIVNLPGTVSFSDTAYTNSFGLYSITVPGGGTSPDKQWRVSSYDQCNGTFVSDTVSNCNGNNSSVTADGMLMRTDTAFNSCFTDRVTPVQSTASWTLSDWVPVAATLSYTVTNISVTASNYSFTKQELCTFCIPPACYFTNIYNDTLTTGFFKKIYDASSGMIYISAVAANVPLFIKLDGSGNVLVAKQYNVNCTNTGSMERAPNGDFIFTGTSVNSFYVMRLDTLGNVLWAKDFSSSGRDWFPFVVRSSGDSYFIGCWHSPGTTRDDATFMRIDGNGNILWTKKFDSPLDDQILDIVSDGNGGCLFTGEMIDAGDSVKLFLGNLDTSGNTLWLKKVNGVDAEGGWGIIRTLDGGYALNGRCGQSANTVSSVFLLKLDSSLGISWLNKIDIIANNNLNMPTPLVQDKYGSYYIPANTTLADGTIKGQVIKYDDSGNYLWSKTLDYISDNGGGFSMVNTNGTPDNIIVIGSSFQHPVGTGTECSPGFTILNTCTQPCNAAFSHAVTGTTVAFTNTSQGSNLSYQWTFGDSSSSQQFSPTHLYSQSATYTACLSISNNSGCIDTSCATIVTGSTACSASFTYTMIGNTVAFSSTSSNASAYLWDFGDSSSSTSSNPTHTFANGIYNVCMVISNVSGCSDTSCTTLSFIPCSILAGNTGVVSNSLTICSGDSIQFQAFGGISYAWFPAIGLSTAVVANPSAAPVANTTYTVVIHYSANCPDTSFTVNVVVDQNCVWPGDANDDGIADNLDVLAIGIGYGISGFTRPNASTNWEGQPSPDWLLQLAGGANLKHVDCDGSALIDSSDVSAISLNYGLTHQKSGGSPEKMIDPDLYLEFPQDSFSTGDTVTGTINLGTVTTPVSNIYGIAFSLLYDQNIIDSGSIHIDFTNSWIAPASRVSLAKDVFAASRVDIGHSRTDHNNVSGYGVLADVSFVIQDNIDGKDFLILPFEIQFEDVTAIDKDEAPLNLSANGDTLFVKDEISGITPADAQHNVRIFPNPASGEITILSDFAIAEYSLMDLAGKEIIYKKVGNNHRHSIDMSVLEPGSYFVNLKSADHYTICRKIVVCR